MPLWFAITFGGLAGLLAGALAGWASTRFFVANSFATEREQTRAILARARIDLEEAGSELEKWSHRGARERARVEQAERRAKPNGADTPTHSFPDARAYGRHLTKGGERDPAFERTMGWPNRG